MAATTTENNTDLPVASYLRPYSTQMGYSTGSYPFLIFSTDGSSGANHKIGGFCQVSTGMEQVRFPINSPGAKSLIVAIFCGKGPTSTFYGFLGIKNSISEYAGMSMQSSMQPASVGAATLSAAAYSGWTFYETTAALLQAATENATYILGPLDLTQNYLSLDGSSGNAIDKNQNYIQVTAGYSSIGIKGTTNTYAEISTNHPIDCDSGIYVAHFEVP